MEKSYKNILRRSRQRIVDDLDVTDVLDRLLGEEVVGVELDDNNHNDKYCRWSARSRWRRSCPDLRGRPGFAACWIFSSREVAISFISFISGTFSSDRESSSRSESLRHISGLPEGELQLVDRPDDGKPCCGWRTEDHGNILKEWRD